jgi:ubiquinone/menaquinone biosynthesis C-methylase UbiE
MALFRKSGEAHALSIAMTGVRLGDRLLQIGCVDPTLLGAISAKVGLSGLACVAVRSTEMAARAQRGAERAGVLIEIEQTDFTKLPFPDASFDLVVIDSTDGMLGSMSPNDRDACFREALRVLAGRGRVVVIESGSRPGFAGLLRRQPVNPSYQASGGSIAALTAARFRAVRSLVERDGLSFMEGTK